MNWRTLSSRALAQVVRPTARPLWVGILVALGFLAAEVGLVAALRIVAPENAFGALLLLGVLVVSAGWDFPLAIATSLASAAVYAYLHLEGRDSLAPALAVFLTLALLTNVLVGQARLRAAEAEQRRKEALGLARQQAALRRLATLVARAADLSEIYQVAVRELAHSLAVDHVTLVRFRPDGSCLVMAAHDLPEVPGFGVGEEFSLSGDNMSGQIYASGAPARIDDYAGAAGPIAQRLHQLGVRCGAGAPLMVGGAVRGALLVGARRPASISRSCEDHLGDFADLVSTAIANTETRAALTASRARLVAAADEARRGFERDLHDGAQQRIVSLSLELRAVEAAATDASLRAELGRVVDGLAELHTDLQELSRGMHPAVLSRGGLRPALRALARRCTIPVELDIDVDTRLPESVEVAAYYVVAESLTNAAKYAEAEVVIVRVAAADGVLTLSVSDDGVGGAVAGAGSGLGGLRDRVEALSGQLDIDSPPGGGTTVTAVVPAPVSG
ncbi:MULTISPECIES: GAF domain-containing sensor histidine kinase [Mycobacteriaceae]|uniref:GAF domain-containing sensor histidine kinase n=1 Tax=Mycobacteriaceae TaxID=1762 RepID=UPI0004EF779D|nr:MULTISPECIES: GAF domain-containing sensor histidine kinase [Mycobacteriaceae]AHC24944.2 histidine kinase [Mycolicibacterium neoaurum VKM Ac-1815D]AMO05478.1 histidine kinase [Mycolicibacterium neoaurum]AXK76203.1 GAF domain-containing protein [Mycolicibacterium neoaurum]KJQ50678.1 histidine kinase [Mycolicibacterium neoaurum]KUM09862.1 histidine kinase [Mycolicibacterium neoaurum]